MKELQPIEVSNRVKPFIVGVGGFSSDVGKTTLLCSLLRAFAGWEAIKTTRGHYRSCGKDPKACCVSDLLDEDAVIRSGRVSTYEPGKDTGKYWDAGAANVHWVIATDAQVDQGIRTAMDHVRSEAVFIEGNSFTRSMAPDFFIMVVRPDRLSIKSTARRAMSLVSAIYVSEECDSVAEESLKDKLINLGSVDPKTPIYSRSSFPALVEKIRTRLLTTRQPKQNKVASDVSLAIEASRH